MEITVRYRKNQVLWPLAIGSSLVICGVMSRFYGSSEAVGFIGIGSLWIGIAFHKWHSGYLTLGKDFIRRNDSPFFKKIGLSQITEIKKFAGDWILKHGNNKELVISPQVMDEQGLSDFEKFLTKLDCANV